MNKPDQINAVYVEMKKYDKSITKRAITAVYNEYAGGRETGWSNFAYEIMSKEMNIRIGVLKVKKIIDTIKCTVGDTVRFQKSCDPRAKFAAQMRELFPVRTC